MTSPLRKAATEMASPALELRGLSVDIGVRGRHASRRQRSEFFGQCRRDVRACRRIRLRQDDDRARHHGIAAAPRPRFSRDASSLDGLNVANMSERTIAGVRGNRMSMIFQDPMTSLNPVYTIGSQLEEVFVRHGKGTPREARERAEFLLERIGIISPAARLAQYPHQLSGGLRQRMMIAMALMCEPTLLIADEPTTALDVTVQAQILRLLADLQRTMNLALILITHDLGIVARMADRVAVMYGGRIVETATCEALFARPSHPYTRGPARMHSLAATRRTTGRHPRHRAVPDRRDIQVASSAIVARGRRGLRRWQDSSTHRFARSHLPLHSYSRGGVAACSPRWRRDALKQSLPQS